MQSFFIIDRYLLTAVMLMLPLIALRAEQNGNAPESSDRLKKDGAKNKRNLSARTRSSSRKAGDIKKQTGDQVSGNAEVLELDRMIVLGNRASLATAQEIKREKIEIVDSVAANTINKLPDFNVSDALQRITGVQILRDRGEGSNMQIRGLSQVETFLSGREIFTAGNGRNLDYADISADLLAGIDVYKTPSPDFIEGGIGGTVNLRTHLPFDFLGREIVGTVRGVYGDLADSAEPQFSTLLSISSSYTDLLPSKNLRNRLTEGLNLPSGASQTLTRPDFNQLSPSLVLIPNSINPTLNSGSAGNPHLMPVHSTKIDGSVLIKTLHTVLRNGRKMLLSTRSRPLFSKTLNY